MFKISNNTKIKILFVIFVHLVTNNCENKTLESDENVIPYIALISSRLGESTGVIIHPEWILTSAYSLVDKEGIQLHDAEIQIGVAFSKVYSDNWDVQMKYKSKKVIVHEKYHSNSTIPNVGLVQTDVLPLNDSIQPISIRARPWSNMENNDCYEVEWKKDVDPPNKYKNYLANWKVVARHGKDACPCITYSNYLENYICLKGTCGCTFCSSNLGGAVICEMELVGIKHRILDCRVCQIGQMMNTCPQQSLYRMYTYVCPYRRWISKYVTTPKDLKYDVVCSHFASRKSNEASKNNFKPVMYNIVAIVLIVKYYTTLYFIKIF